MARCDDLLSDGRVISSEAHGARRARQVWLDAHPREGRGFKSHSAASKRPAIEEPFERVGSFVWPSSLLVGRVKDRTAGRRGVDEPRDRRPSLLVPPHRRFTPVPDLPEAQWRVSPRACGGAEGRATNRSKLRTRGPDGRYPFVTQTHGNR